MLRIEMTDAITQKTWAWSNKSYKNVSEFVSEYNEQAEKFGIEKITEQKSRILSNGDSVVVHLWVFKVV